MPYQMLHRSMFVSIFSSLYLSASLLLKAPIVLLYFLLFSASPAAFSQIPNTPQVPGTLLSHNDPEMGRLAVIEILGDYVITIPEKPSSPAGSDFLVRAWDISNPSSPSVVATFGETEHPFLAHGAIKSGRELYIGGYPQNAIRLETDGSLSHVSWSGPEGYFGKSGMNRPWAARDFWSYNSPSGNAWLSLDGEETASWDHLGQTGVIGFPMFMGNLMVYASDQSNTGVATYDVSDPSNPRLLDVLNTDEIHPRIGEEWGIGGYWNEIYGHYVVFARRQDNPGIQVVDFSDPNNLRLHCDFLVKDPDLGIEPDSANQFGNPMYLGFQDEYVFAERYKLNIETCEAELILDEITNQVETNQYSRPIGNLLATGGMSLWVLNNNPAGMGLWAHQAEPDNRPPYVAYHIPEVNQQNFPVFAPISLMIPETLRSETMIAGESLVLRVVDGEQVEIEYVLSHTGMLTVNPTQNLLPNTTYEFSIAGVEDAVGNPMEYYSFRFSTGEDIDLSAPSNLAPIINNLSIQPAGIVQVGETVTISPSASDSDGDQLEYRASSEGHSDAVYGDWSAAPVFEYSYSSAGVYRVNVQVRDTSGVITTASRNITVSSIDSSALSASESATASSPVAFNAATNSVWVVNPDNDSVAEISPDGSILGEYDAGNDPRSVAIAQNGDVWVASFGSDQIRVFEPSGLLVNTINTGYGTAPFGISFNPDGNEVYASLYGSGEILRINPTSRLIQQRLTLPQDTQSDMLPTPRAMAVSSDGSRLLVTRFVSPQNWGEVFEIDLTNFSLNRTYVLDQSIDPDDLDSGRGIPNHLSSIAVSQDGRWAYVVGTKDNIGGGFQNGNLVDIDDDNTVRTFLAILDLENGVEVSGWRSDFDNADSPSAVMLAPNENYLFVAIQGGNEVWAFSRNEQTGALSSTSIAQFAVGLAPQGIGLDAATGSTYVKNFTERTLTKLNLSDFLSSGQLNPSTQTFSTVSSEVLSAQELLGKQIFYNAVNGISDADSTGVLSAEGYISCATCHMDGAQNGRTYDFTGRGEGLRNNISMLGRSGTRFGRVHWSANFDEIQDFEHDIRDRFLGRGLMDDNDFATAEEPLGNPKAGLDEDLDALAAYVESLNADSLPRSHYRITASTMTAAGVSGEAVFIESGCSDCHLGKAYTDGLTHDVGTSRLYSGAVSSFKTPSLLGVYSTAPYLHDGSAARLEDVFMRAGGEVLQLEEGTLSGSATRLQVQIGSSLRHGGGVSLSAGGSVEVFGTSSSAGDGIVHLRFGSTSPDAVVQITVGDDSRTLSLPVLPEVDGQHVAFSEVSAAVSLVNGQNNIQISSESGTFVVDDITLSSPDDLVSAQGHHVVRSLSANDQTDLIEFLRQLDRTSAPSDLEDPFAPIQIDGNDQSENWVFCSDEGEYCAFEGEKEVRYGADGEYNSAVFIEGTDCSNDVFGDPIRGVVKTCEFYQSTESSQVEDSGPLVIDENPVTTTEIEPAASEGGAGSTNWYTLLLAIFSVVVWFGDRRRLAKA